MNGLLPHDPRHVPGPAHDHDPLPHHHLRVPPPDAVHIQEAVLVDMRNLQPDLVHMTGEHDPWPPVGTDLGERMPMDIRPHPFGEAASLIPPGTRGPRLEPRRPRLAEETLEKRSGLLHGPCSVWSVAYVRGSITIAKSGRGDPPVATVAAD